MLLLLSHHHSQLAPLTIFWKYFFRWYFFETSFLKHFCRTVTLNLLHSKYLFKNDILVQYFLHRHSKHAPLTISFENDITLEILCDIFSSHRHSQLVPITMFSHIFFFVETLLWKPEPEFPTSSSRNKSVLPFGEARVCLECYFVALLSILGDWGKG